MSVNLKIISILCVVESFLIALNSRYLKVLHQSVYLKPVHRSETMENFHLNHLHILILHLLLQRGDRWERPIYLHIPIGNYEYWSKNSLIYFDCTFILRML